MTIEVMTLITGISVTLGIVSTLINLRRNSRVDAKTTIIEAANILIGISELKVKLNTMEADQKDSRERIIILEEKVKTLFINVQQLQEHLNIDSK